MAQSDGVLQGVSGVAGMSGIASNSFSGISGEKGALDKNNTKGKEGSRRQFFDRIDVEDGTGSSQDNGRSQGIDGDAGFYDVGEFWFHMRIFEQCVI